MNYNFQDFHPEMANPEQARARMELFQELPENVQTQYWASLRSKVDRNRDAKVARSREPSLPADIDQKLKGIEARSYVEAIAGIEVTEGRQICCPLPDHNDKTPSFAIKDTRWRCFGCGESGTIYDLASIIWGIPSSGRGFKELQERLHDLRIA